MAGTILVTGANRGIGLEIVKQYRQDDWYVIACSRHTEFSKKLEAVGYPQEEGKLLTLTADVTNMEHIKNLTEQVKTSSIDILFNNAGVFGPTHVSFGSVELTSWLDVFKVNTIAPLMMAQSLIKQIARSKLKIIVNISSIMGSIKNNIQGGEYIYRSSKAALNAITKSMAVDLKDAGVTVVSLHPGWVKTDMGGSNAQITPSVSVNGIKEVLSKLTLQDSGSFIGFDGSRISW